MDGYRMAAEWEGQEGVWVSRPHNVSTWPGCLDRAREQFDVFVKLLGETTRVRDVGEVGIETDDSWIRDYGPVFVVKGDGGEGVGGRGVVCHDFRFNCWGGKYPDYGLDDAVGGRLGEVLGVEVVRHGFVLEGGAVDVNGRGTVLTTRSCLLDPADLSCVRNPGMGRAEVEGVLHGALCGGVGESNVVWLDGGIDGDDTDGHVDDVARFVSADTVLAVRGGEGERERGVLERNWEVLCGARDQDGGRLNVVGLPVPRAMYYDYPGEGGGSGWRGRLPASYANFLISNGQVLVPVFGVGEDELALRVIEGAMPGYRVVPVRSEWLVAGLGALHCLTMQQPRVDGGDEGGGLLGGKVL